MCKPNFLLLGAPRCGTSWISKNLMHHPEIYLPEKKEIHYFDWNLEKGLDWYKKQFRGIGTYFFVGEATPSYLALNNGPQLIYEALGKDLKFIVCVRDPVERLYSRYWNTVAKYKHNSGKSFRSKIEEKPEFINEGKYALHLENYFSKFDRKQFHICFYEDLKKEPEEFLNSIAQFLGVTSEFSPPRLNHKVNSAASKKRVGHSDLLYYLSRILKRIKWYSAMDRVESLNRIQYPEMDKGVREELITSEYRIYNEKLQDLTGRDLSSWNTY